MAEPMAPRAATLPITLITRESVGYTVQAWQPPADGWIPLGPARKFATSEEAGDAAAPITAGHNGTHAILMFPPGFKPVDFRRRKQ